MPESTWLAPRIFNYSALQTSTQARTCVCHLCTKAQRSIHSLKLYQTLCGAVPRTDKSFLAKKGHVQARATCVHSLARHASSTERKPLDTEATTLQGGAFNFPCSRKTGTITRWIISVVMFVNALYCITKSWRSISILGVSMIWSHNQKPVSLALQDEREWWGQSSFESDNTLSHDLTTDKQHKLCVV